MMIYFCGRVNCATANGRREKQMIAPRKVAASSATLIAALLLAGEGHAQANYPQRVIKMIVPAPAGGQTDVMARLIAQKMHQPLGQSVIIDNRPGAGGALAARAAASAEPDGYTLFYGNTSTLAVIPAVSKNPGYDPVRNFDPVASVSESYTILVVHPAFPAQNIQEFLKYARAHPGKLNYAHAGAGNVTHLIGEMLRTLADVDFVDVPHKGGNESVQSVLGQQVDFTFESPVILLSLIREGKLRALAVTSAKRQAEIPDVPSMVESGITGFVATLLTGIVTPAPTPSAVVTKLNDVINQGLRGSDMKDLMVKFGSEVRVGSSDAFATFLAAETEKWRKIAQQAGVSLD
jgi:tripartite-type tricarboxylate transporter receptor subunit TctC